MSSATPAPTVDAVSLVTGTSVSVVITALAFAFATMLRHSRCAARCCRMDSMLSIDLASPLLLRGTRTPTLAARPSPPSPPPPPPSPPAARPLIVVEKGA